MNKDNAKETALSYIDEYPITRYMDGRHIDYARAAVRAKTDIRVIFVGFDEVCRELLLASIRNDQLIGTADNGISKKQIKYYILSPESPWEGLKDAFRYQHEFLADAALDTTEYFGLPEPPSTTEYIRVENGDARFAALAALLRPAPDTLPLFRVIISEALCSATTAKTLDRLLAAYGAAEYTKAFALGTVPPQGAVTLSAKPIRRDAFFDAAKERNRLYYEDNLSGAASADELAEARAAADAKWETCGETTHESNIYSVIWMRLKLNLMGLDIAEYGALNRICEKEYNRLYYAAKPKAPSDNGLPLSGGLDSINALRDILAVQEHMRWNAFMICGGYVPARKADCLDAARGYGKSAELKLHRNIASISGLVEYRRHIADNQYREGRGAYEALEQAADVIKYDYQLMDDAYRVLARLNKNIVRRE